MAPPRRPAHPTFPGEAQEEEAQEEGEEEASTRIPPPQLSILTVISPFRQPDVKSLSLHVPWSVRPQRSTISPLVTPADLPFPATLLLLLAISVVIVGRSVVIRRRARRTIEEAVRNGTWLPQAGRPSVRLGEKPKLFDVYTTMAGVPGKSPTDDGLLAWGDLKVRPPPSVPDQRVPTAHLYPQPLSVTLKKTVSPSPQVTGAQSPPPTEPPTSLLLRLAPQLRPTPRVTTPGSSAHPLETLKPSRKKTLTVSVMIAMPTPPTTKPHNSSDDPFPPVQVGVTHLPIPQGWATNAKSEHS